MQNYLLTLAYDGTNYCGFQVQPNGRSVAQTFQDGLEAVLHSRPDIKGCSRTDAGVHALGFALNLHPGAPAAGCGCHAEGGGTVCGKARFSGPVRGGFLCCCPRRYRAHHH